jgi:hypothetical protein
LVHLVEEQSSGLSSAFIYSEPTANLVLAAREYFILERTNSVEPCEESCVASDSADIPMTDVTNSDSGGRLMQAIGSRVESNCGPDHTWKVFTLVSASCSSGSDSGNDCYFVLVSDEGELHSDVSSDQIRMTGIASLEETSRTRRSGRTARDERSGIFPFFAPRQRSDFSRGDNEDGQSDTNHTKALKRSWSALSLIASMRPVDFKISGEMKEPYQSEISTD